MPSVACGACGERNAEFSLFCRVCGASLGDALLDTATSGVSLATGDPGDRVSVPEAGEGTVHRAPGARLGPYQLIDKLGAGGAGVVYRALDTRLQRPIALKFLSPQQAQDPVAKARLLREARAASKLDHPCIGAVHAIEELDGELFIVEALYDGETLQRRLKAGPVPIAEAVGLLEQIASGLAAAHAAGIVHRDLKPSNVVLTSAGQAKLVDFGLAKPIETPQPGSDGPLTQTGEILGTVAYMSPEQARGEPLDARTDLWSLGVMGYEILAGSRPFDAPHQMATVSRIFNDRPRPLTELRPDVPVQLQSLIERLLEKERDNRPRTAMEVLEVLRQGRDDVLPKAASSPSPGSALGIQRPRDRPAPRLAIGALLLVLAALAGTLAIGGWLSGTRSGGAKDELKPLRRSLAVLGFANLSGRGSSQVLSTGLPEMLATELGAGGELRLISGDDVAQMKEELGLRDASRYTSETLARIGKYLGADYLLLGSYTALGKNSGDQLWFDLRLVDSRTNETLDRVSEAGTEAQLFQLVTQAGAKLRKTLGIGPRSAAEASQVRDSLPASPAAAALYSEGLTLLRFHDVPGARSALEKAVAAAPAFPLSHLALADVWSQLGDEQQAGAEAKKAFELSASLPLEERRRAEARYRTAIAQWPRAAELFRALFTLAPDNLEYGLHLAEAQVYTGQFSQAFATLDQMRQVPPPIGNDPRIDLAEAMAALAIGDVRRAQTVSAKAATKARELAKPLLLAQARFWEGDALRSMGRASDALRAFDEARKTFVEMGHRQGEAFSLFGIGTVQLLIGQPQEAGRSLEQALAVCELAGGSRGFGWINRGWIVKRVGDVLQSQDDLSGARKQYEEARVDCRRSSNQPCMQQIEQDLGNLLYKQGDLAAAKARFEAVLESSTAFGDLDGIGNASLDLGAILRDHGHLAEAQAMFESAQATFRETGDRGNKAEATGELGELTLLRGDFASARQMLKEALDLRNTIGEQTAIPGTHLSLARLALAEGSVSEAESLARKVAEEFRRQERPQREGLAQAVLALVLLQKGEHAEAQAAAARALELAGASEVLFTRLTVGLAAARVHGAAAPGDHGAIQATESLEALLGDASRAGLVGFELEARLAMAEIELRSGLPDARISVHRIETNAADKGFGLIAQQAAAILRSGQ